MTERNSICQFCTAEGKHHLRIGRQTKEEKWLMPHIRSGCPYAAPVEPCGGMAGTFRESYGLSGKQEIGVS